MEKLLQDNKFFQIQINLEEKLLIEQLLYKIEINKMLVQYTNVANLQIKNNFYHQYKKIYIEKCIELELFISELYKKYSNSEDIIPNLSWKIDLNKNTIIWFKRGKKSHDTAC